ncbi:hypothetical protein F4781DRAFT_88279 [Annulohypoxylon bovei var. microspora]|nr:hypothetical protein F4781DRAFT_88279 [Annulohypoxylon bovei var. microspora]
MRHDHHGERRGKSCSRRRPTSTRTTCIARDQSVATSLPKHLQHTSYLTYVCLSAVCLHRGRPSTPPIPHPYLQGRSRARRIASVEGGSRGRKGQGASGYIYVRAACGGPKPKAETRERDLSALAPPGGEQCSFIYVRACECRTARGDAVLRNAHAHRGVCIYTPHRGSSSSPPHLALPR